jgi:type IV secretion system protein VirB2
MQNVHANPTEPAFKQKQAFFIMAMATLMVLASFNLAFAGPIEDGVDWVLDLLTNGIARSVAIIGIVILGYLAWAGKITGEACLKFVLGIVLVFGGASIVDLIISAVS